MKDTQLTINEVKELYPHRIFKEFKFDFDLNGYDLISDLNQMLDNNDEINYHESEYVGSEATKIIFSGLIKYYLAVLKFELKRKINEASSSGLDEVSSAALTDQMMLLDSIGESLLTLESDEAKKLMKMCECNSAKILVLTNNENKTCFISESSDISDDKLFSATHELDKIIADIYENVVFDEDQEKDTIVQ